MTVLDNLCNSSRRALDRVEQLAGRKLQFVKGDVRNRPLLNALFAAYLCSGAADCFVGQVFPVCGGWVGR